MMMRLTAVGSPTLRHHRSLRVRVGSLMSPVVAQSIHWQMVRPTNNDIFTTSIVARGARSMSPVGCAVDHWQIVKPTEPTPSLRPTSRKVRGHVACRCSVDHLVAGRAADQIVSHGSSAPRASVRGRVRSEKLRSRSSLGTIEGVRPLAPLVNRLPHRTARTTR